MSAKKSFLSQGEIHPVKAEHLAPQRYQLQANLLSEEVPHQEQNLTNEILAKHCAAAL
jgi:hypothetical protein